MSEFESARRAKATLEIVETIGRLSGIASDEAGALSSELWRDLAATELGWAWHDVGPDGSLSAAQAFLQHRSAAA